MNKEEIIQKTLEFVKEKHTGESSGHDWWHIYRVWKNVQHISKSENVDLFVVEMAALLHDIADWKFYGGDELAGARAAREWLVSLEVDSNIVDHVCDIIATSSFKGAGVTGEMKTLEGKVLQDADWLDAIGAVGIARTFAYGGFKNRIIYDPNIKPEFHTSAKAYNTNVSPTINHFYEKLLLLKDRLNTETAKKIAEGRHVYMEEYLKQFFAEWEGEK